MASGTINKRRKKPFNRSSRSTALRACPELSRRVKSFSVGNGAHRQELPGLFVADLPQQRLPVLDVLFVLLRGEPVLRPPAFERLLFRCAAVLKLFQDLLAVRTQEKISHENR